MRYKAKGHIIDAEHAALSSERGAKWLLDWIARLEPHYCALDYGCGRLRYSLPLAKRCKSVMIVDSERQFSRTMTIHGVATTIPEFVADHSHCIAAKTVPEFEDENTYDFALCVNVLSSVPSHRSRYEILRTLIRALKPGGVALVINQHRNSYFKSYAARKDVLPCLDGWLVPVKGRMTFYGLIHPIDLATRCKKIGILVVKQGCKGESGYVLLEKPNGQSGSEGD